MVSNPLIYVIRHGQTDWNVEERFQGSRDIPINETGRLQADRNGLALKEVIGDQAAMFDFVASPLGRARETMERVRAAMSLPPQQYRTDDRLIEVSFGDWEGHTLVELEALENSARMRTAERRLSKWDFQPPGDRAESYEILSWRIAAWLESVRQPTVCVSHGGVVRSLFYLIAGLNGQEAADMATPQDRIVRIEGQSIEWMPSFDTGA
jgi:probable phosphoglycerate mutase